MQLMPGVQIGGGVGEGVTQQISPPVWLTVLLLALSSTGRVSLQCRRLIEPSCWMDVGREWDERITSHAFGPPPWWQFISLPKLPLLQNFKMAAKKFGENSA